MNFTPFGSPFPTTIPLHQFAAANQLVSTASTVQETNNRYQTSNVNTTHFNQSTVGTGTTMIKYNTATIATTGVTIHGNNQYNAPYTQQSTDDKQRTLGTVYSTQSTVGSTPTISAVQAPELSQDLCNAILQQQNDAKRVLQNVNSGWQSLNPGSAVADYLSHLPASTLPLSLHHFLKYSAETIKKETQQPAQLQTHQQQHQIQQQNPTSQQIQQLQPQHIQQQQTQLLQPQQLQQNSVSVQTHGTAPAHQSNPPSGKKKKRKKTKEKKQRPRPGEIRLTTALDGSTLFCCPECQMAYPERGLLEQHLVGHNLERRFICDICNAALKRKDHLTRHKQSHNPDRPYVCTICLKAFKRKEQLTLHFVIHSGEKRHICTECGKGFYRKDHLRKHTRSHIARRVKAELSQQNEPTVTPTTVAAPVQITLSPATVPQQQQQQPTQQQQVQIPQQQQLGTQQQNVVQVTQQNVVQVTQQQHQVVQHVQQLHFPSNTDPQQHHNNNAHHIVQTLQTSPSNQLAQHQQSGAMLS